MRRKKETVFTQIDTDIAVKVENLTKIYGGETLNAVAAVNNITLTVKKGEFVAIVGTSGSGKSTLMHMLAGVEKPTKGKVYVCGHDIYSMNDKQLSKFRCREIGIVYQFFNLIPVLNVEENIAFPIIAMGDEPDFNKVNEIIKKLNLKGKGTSFPNQLSGGQQQRVAIGRLIMTSPTLVLADEPTGNLDSKNSKEVIGLLSSLCKDMGRTLIIITHDEKIAAEADRIIRIEDGEIFSDTQSEKAVV